MPVCEMNAAEKVLKMAKVAKVAKISKAGWGAIFSRGRPQTHHCGEDPPADKPGIQKPEGRSPVKRLSRSALVALMLLMLLTPCGFAQTPAPDPLQVVASFSVLGDL